MRALAIAIALAACGGRDVPPQPDAAPDALVCPNFCRRPEDVIACEWRGDVCWCECAR